MFLPSALDLIEAKPLKSTNPGVKGKHTNIISNYTLIVELLKKWNMWAASCGTRSGICWG